MVNAELKDVSRQLFEAERACLVAPAGYGKTQTISKAVSYSDTGKQLILTHTHAGVQSLRKRLRNLGVKPTQYEIDTIHGWAFSLVRSYPKTAGFSTLVPRGSDWTKILEAATHLLQLGFMKTVIQASYVGVFVDEYQDCSIEQHELILRLIDILPCRIVGDPLQGIFNFGNTQLVDWESDIFPLFRKLPDLTTPYRWLSKNQALGEWLHYARGCLEKRTPIELDTSIVNWIPEGTTDWIEACTTTENAQGTIIAIHPGYPADCHEFARQLNGYYQSIEEMEARDLMRFAERFDACDESELAGSLIEFLELCVVEITQEVEDLVQELNDKNFGNVLNILKQIERIPRIKFFRTELWNEMKNSITTYNTGEFPSLYEAAYYSRNSTKLSGRREFKRIASRTLLIKGLEYDHAIVLGADRYNIRNLYVAITRGARSLTIVSDTQFLNPHV